VIWRVFCREEASTGSLERLDSVWPRFQVRFFLKTVGKWGMAEVLDDFKQRTREEGVM
jgi:hypothetical protein